MEWGEHLDKLPHDSPVILNAPVLMAGLDVYLTAYTDLQSECFIGMEKGKIPWYSVVRWCKFYGINCPDVIDRFVTYIRALEAEQAGFMAKKKGKNGNS
jgi:hypothetical protein